MPIVDLLFSFCSSILHPKKKKIKIKILKNKKEIKEKEISDSGREERKREGGREATRLKPSKKFAVERFWFFSCLSQFTEVRTFLSLFPSSYRFGLEYLLMGCPKSQCDLTQLDFVKFCVWESELWMPKQFEQNF